MSRQGTTSLDGILADLERLGFDTGLDDHPGTGWVRLDAYAADRNILDGGLRLAGARFGRPEPTAASGGWLVGDVAAAVAWPAVAAMLTHRRLVIARTTDVHLPHPSAARRLAARIAPPRPVVSASAGVFAAGIVATLRPVVEAVHVRTRRGRHALWGTVTDMIAAAFHRVGDHLDQSSEARHLAAAVIDGSTTLTGGANWHDVDWSGGTKHTRIRNICCLWYQSPGGDLCLTCPRITDQQRKDLLEQRAPLNRRGRTPSSTALGCGVDRTATRHRPPERSRWSRHPGRATSAAATPTRAIAARTRVGSRVHRARGCRNGSVK